MVKLEVNQQVGRAIPNSFWLKIIKEIEKVLKIRKNGKISLALVDEKTIKKLNFTYRKKNAVTDVLSFSEIESKKPDVFGKNDDYWGEVIICYPRAVKQAKASKEKLNKELAWLFIHGTLHLLGYTHDKARARSKMRSLEDNILKAVLS